MEDHRVRSIAVPAVSTATASACMVWLPGAYHGAQDFVTAGFAQAVHARQLSLDLVFIDMELEHVGDRSTLQKLHSDIVSPARAAGISIWLGGISLGGMFALNYAASHPDEVDGLCLLAPYLGNRMLTNEIAVAPGLAAWQPGELAEAEEERRLWSYVKNRHAGSPPLYLGFGREDRFSAAHELLAATLPADSVDVIPGGHEWPIWFSLWENFLDSRFI
jgi:pimeloyl-ACP methyl ester carboxylesterase